MTKKRLLHPYLVMRCVLFNFNVGKRRVHHSVHCGGWVLSSLRSPLLCMLFYIKGPLIKLEWVADPIGLQSERCHVVSSLL
mmetsp:Transcript_32565/g.54883  ORF Transcript_32565/g.54883 Transcript_32565/m.54883 type:complete len:81 (-) Transcript_32565:106-348(-)